MSATSICSLCEQSFTIDQSEREFIERMVFTFGKTKIHPELPRECPDCRLKLRTAHRNERFLYKRKSGKSGRDTVSVYHKEPMRPCTVWAQDEWHADAWDALDYGRVFDFGKSFFDQFSDLQTAVPRPAVVTVGNENCDFTTGTGYCKNCYLINSSEYCEDCCYGKLFQKCRSCFDCTYIFDSELCYQCFSVYTCYQCRFVSFSKNCTDCHFSTSLLGCKNCFLCSNLERKEHHFQNEPLPKAEYEKRVAEYLGSQSGQQKAIAELEALRAKSIHRAANILNCESCTGDYLENSKNCIDCYDVTEGQDCRSVTVGIGAKDCLDCSNMYVRPELAYMTLGTIETFNVAYSLYVFHSSNILYSENCHHSKDLFGCVGLRHKQYCILNKQYTKEEYETLVPKIIDQMTHSTGSGQASEWGAYFPARLSPFGYSESLAHEYMPLAKNEALKMGFHWRDTTDEPPFASKVIAATDLPDRIDQIPDDVLNWALICEASGRPYKLQKSELAFYRQQAIPVPRRHPDLRYDERMKLRNPRTLWKRTCGNCKKETFSTFAPERREVIYCDECFREKAMK